MEKEQSYKDAADNYEVAWKMENESNVAIGYVKQYNENRKRMYLH